MDESLILFEVISSLLLGLVVGVVSTFLGIGGGLIIVPLLPFISQLDHVQAVATSLTTIFMVVTANSVSPGFRERIHKKFAAPMAVVAGGFAFTSAWVAPLLPTWSLQIYLLLLYVWSLALCLNVLDTGFFSRLKKTMSEKSTDVASKLSASSVGFAVFVGVSSGLAGVGAGLVLVPYMIFTRLVRADQVIPTSNAIMIGTTFSGLMAYLLQSQFNTQEISFISWPHAGLIFLGSLIGGIPGRRYQHLLPELARKIMLATVLTLLMIRLILELL